jgi:hypothetical protein
LEPLPAVMPLAPSGPVTAPTTSAPMARVHASTMRRPTI